MKQIIYILLLFLNITSCSSNYKDTELEHALELAGKNRKTLENVLYHYKNDSLKYQAACFLIKNMPYHYSQEDYYLSPKGEKYRPDIRKFEHKEKLTRHCDSLIQCGYIEKHDVIYDIFSIDSLFLIRNIDLAFMVWKKPWAKDIPFEEFCTYILPYRAQTEKISFLRKEIMERFLPLLDSLEVKTSLEACIALNKHLKSIVKYQETGLSFYPTIEETYQSGISRCDGICNLGTFIMRAVGIPVAVDFTIWPKMDLGHSWCVVWSNGRFYSFGPGEDQPDIHAKMFSQKRNRRPAKVYRHQFNLSYYSPKISINEYRTFLDSPLLYDVTNEYLDKPTSFQVPILDNNGNINEQVYLCIYNYYKWEPLAIGSYSTDGICSFENVVGDNIFIVVNIINDKIQRYITAPFYVSQTGNVHLFIPQLNNKHSFTLKKRKEGRVYTLHYWDINKKSFIPIVYNESTDTTQIYEQIPDNALLWSTLPERIVNQRIFFIRNDSVKTY